MKKFALGALIAAVVIFAIAAVPQFPIYNGILQSDLNANLFNITNGNNASFVTFTGSGANLTALNASQLTSGTIPGTVFPALTGDVTTPGGSLVTTISASSVTLAKMANETANTVLGNNTGAPAAPAALTPSQVLDIIGNTRGAVLERGAGGWVTIAPGASGTFLGGNGAGADPTYQTPAGGGGTVISAGVDIYTNTSSGTIAINVNTNMTNMASIQFTNNATLTGGTGSGLLYSNNNGTVSLSSGLGVFTNTATGADFKSPTNQATANLPIVASASDGSTLYEALPNAGLANSSITIAGTANQVSVAGGGPVALGGTATLSLPSPVIAPGQVSATGLTNQAATGSTAAAYDANGKLISIANAHGVLTNTAAGPPSFGLLQNTELANSSITLNGTAHQVGVSAGGATALGGTATFNVPNQLWSTNDTIWGNGAATNGLEVDAANDAVISNNLGQAVFQAGTMTFGGVLNGTAGNGLTNLYGGALTGAVQFIQWDASAFMTNANFNSNAIAYVTPSAGSGGLQGSTPFYLLYPFSSVQGGTNRFFVQTYMPPSWNSNSVNLSIELLSATNTSSVASNVTFSVSAYWNGSAQTTPVTITNTIPGGTGFIETNVVVGPIPTSGTILPNESVLFQVEYWAPNAVSGKVTNSLWAQGVRLSYTNSTQQNAIVTRW